LNNESNILHDFIPSDSMTIGELADQKPQTNRIVAVCFIFSIDFKENICLFFLSLSRSMILLQEKIKI
jgi:hypothetical protein